MDLLQRLVVGLMLERLALDYILGLKLKNTHFKTLCLRFVVMIIHPKKNGGRRREGWTRSSENSEAIAKQRQIFMLSPKRQM